VWNLFKKNVKESAPELDHATGGVERGGRKKQTDFKKAGGLGVQRERRTWGGQTFQDRRRFGESLAGCDVATSFASNLEG